MARCPCVGTNADCYRCFGTGSIQVSSKSKASGSSRRASWKIDVTHSPPGFGKQPHPDDAAPKQTRGGKRKKRNTTEGHQAASVFGIQVIQGAGASPSMALSGNDYFQFFPHVVAAELRELILALARNGIRKPKEVSLALSREHNLRHHIDWDPTRTALLLKHVFENPRGGNRGRKSKIRGKGVAIHTAKAQKGIKSQKKKRGAKAHSDQRAKARAKAKADFAAGTEVQTRLGKRTISVNVVRK